MIGMVSQFSWNAEVAQRIRNAAKRAVLTVGIPKDATYPDGVKVEAVAFTHEFGDGSVPPRPFMRNTIADRKGEWSESAGRKLRKILKKNATGSARTVLRSLGNEMVDDVRDGIERIVEPALKPSTVREKRIHGAKRPSKPLVDTGLLKDSIRSEVSSQ